MISKLIAIGSLVLSGAVASPLATGEKTALTHKYVKGAKDLYRITAKVDQGGQEVEVTADFQVSILKVTDAGDAEFEFKIEKIEGMPEPDRLTLTGAFDKRGLPREIETEGIGPILAIFSLANCLPGGELEVGKDFKIDWTSAAGGSSLQGKSVFAALQPGEKPVAQIDHSAVLEDGPSTSVTLTIKSKVDVATGILVSGAGTAEIGDMKATFKIERRSPPKS